MTSIKIKKVIKKRLAAEKPKKPKKPATRPSPKPSKKTAILTAKKIKTAAKTLKKKIVPPPQALKLEPLIKPEIKKEPRPTVEISPAVKPQIKITPEPKVAVIAALPKPPELKEVELKLPITLKDLAVKLQEKPSFLIKALMEKGLMAGINQSLDEATTASLCAKYGFKIKKAPDAEELALKIHAVADDTKDLLPRPPIVTFMGHVDHGKTSLLDAIRKTKVVELEHGGITQHIGAYRVILPTGEITFLDTPGHEAFTAMRSRGASVTDLVVLVVAADDGVMPQTREAIDHARAADVPIIVALNKVDKPQADLNRVKKQLSELNLLAEDWGGKTITVPVSAKTAEGIDTLLEMILLEAQMLELKANPKRMAQGIVLEAKLTKGKGPLATLLVANGTLYLNQNILAGKYYGKVRAMFDDCGHSVTAAGPSSPVEVLGMSGVPFAGEKFFVIEEEKTAKDLAGQRQEKELREKTRPLHRINLEDLYSQIRDGKLKELNIILKADMQGSLEAIKETLNKLNVTEIKLRIIHEGVGSINNSDAILAVASNAIILGFNVNSDEMAKETIAKEGLDVRIYNIIYELTRDIQAALEGMLEPKFKKVFLGRAEVKKVFKLSRAGTVAGCLVLKGKIMRTNTVNLLRNGQIVFEGKISSLKRFKDDMREVAEGFECGISLGGLEDLREGDIIEAYEMEKIARKLDLSNPEAL